MAKCIWNVGKSIHGVIIFGGGHTIKKVGGKLLIGSSIYGVVILSILKCN